MILPVFDREGEMNRGPIKDFVVSWIEAKVQVAKIVKTTSDYEPNISRIWAKFEPNFSQISAEFQSNLSWTSAKSQLNFSQNRAKQENEKKTQNKK